MQGRAIAAIHRARRALGQGIRGPQALAFLPALALMAFWLGGEPVLIATALGMPVLFVLTGGFGSDASGRPDLQATSDTILTNTAALSLANQAMARAREAQLGTACLLIEAEGLDAITRSDGEREADALRRLLHERLHNLLRREDRVFRLGEKQFMVLLGPSLRIDLEALLQLSARLQTGIEEPVAVDNTTRFLTGSIGFCGSFRLPEQATGQDMLEGARIALAEAIANGPSAIRAWSESMRKAHTSQKTLLREVEAALHGGQIQPWFQPQVCTSTGRVTGVEALARWIHPERGIVPPAQFLRCLQDSGQMTRLGEVVLQHSLNALRSWDKAGLDVQRVSVNFSDPELREPKLVDRILWELDRFGLTPSRLGIEVLESVIADTADGIVARNIARLSEAGCYIDLDDFGTGHASITSLRRFKVHRLKIDRSFVTRVDRDEDQRRMLAAVLGLADRLGIETLAEGVESLGEHALLAQLGCDHVQGFGIARPMPADRFVDWWQGHVAKINDAQKLGRDATG